MFKRIEILQNIFSNHNGMRIEIKKTKKKTEKFTNMWKLENILRNNQEVKKEITKN